MARKSSARARPAVDLARRIPASGQTTGAQPKTPAPVTSKPPASFSSGTKTPPPVAVATKTPEPPASGFAALLENAAKEILAVTYWFEPAPNPEPYPVTIRFSGHRTDVEGRPGGHDQFLHDETIEKVIPGSGPISLTAKIHDVNPGAWAVTAHIVEPGRHAPGPRDLGKETTPGGTRFSAARLWKRWAPVAGAETPVHTCMPPFAKAPGVIPGVWGALVTLGMIVALALQFLVIALDHLALSTAWLITVIGIAAGIAGSKLWFIVLHRRARRFEGWCIQGFITGSILTATILLIVLRVPAATYLDATAPGLLVAMAIGRFGCFLAGCCGGPPTAARWGVWSSDQHVGARRVPTQLMESVLSLALGLAALAAVLAHGPANGIFFVGGLALYTLGRQLILRLRAEQSNKWPEVAVTVGLAALIIAVEVLFFAQ
jgi:phosphatidylglycerol:prolipoprotein diacylglycerol transferase